MYEYDNPVVPNPYWAAFRVLFKFIIGQLFLIGVIIWWVSDELLKEYRCYQKYGANWKAVYEQYHGTLLHAHLKIAMCLFCLLAVTLILVWFFRQTYRKHKHK